MLDIYLKEDRFVEGLPRAREYVSSARSKLAEDPLDSSNQRYLANRLQRLANFLYKMGNVLEAIEIQREALALYLGLDETRPESYRVKDLAWANYFLAEYLIANDSDEEGLSSLENGLKILRNGVVNSPEDLMLLTHEKRYSTQYSEWIIHLENKEGSLKE